MMTEVIWEALSKAWPTFLLFLAGALLFSFLEKTRPSWHSLAVVAAFTAAIVVMSLYDFWGVLPYPEEPTVEGVVAHYESVKYAYDIWGTGMHGGAVVYVLLAAAFALYPPRQADFLLCALVVIVVFAEGWTSLFENINCNFFQEDIPAAQQTKTEANMSKCERIYGWWYRYFPIIAEIGVMGTLVCYRAWALRQLRRA